MAGVFRAISRARVSIFSIAATYVVSIFIGIVMVHSGSLFALDYRDRLVDRAKREDAGMQAAARGDAFEAAVRDFAANLVMGAVPKSVAGFGVVFPFPLVVHQGWVGGIVSVRGDHTSRLNTPASAAYFLLTLLLQIVPYSITIGAGINVGVSMFRPRPYYRGDKLIRIFPKEAMKDLGRAFIPAVPLFFVASTWEFLSTWNV